jgi:hypothetical protein
MSSKVAALANFKLFFRRSEDSYYKAEDGFFMAAVRRSLLASSVSAGASLS